MAALPALILVLFPLTSRADVGSLGGVVLIAFWIALAIWSGLTLGVFLLFRRLKGVLRIGVTAAFFLSPVLLGAVTLLKDELFDEHTVQVEESTQGPLTVAGATFPAGSVAKYEQTSSMFNQHILPGWHMRRALLEIHSRSPVLLDHVRITGLRFDEGSNDIYPDLDGDQIIDGWNCAAGPFGPKLSLTAGDPQLRSCWLSASRQWHGQVVPAGANVSRVGDTGDWDWLPPD
ncbi:MAG TPA: hypothetical protein VF573_13410 [Paraburkholderia sp.]|uniref:hypothetical protein n=1 Tax=Paraburkholderia sp. TaxID=1926495 RepID=UPI002ED11179